MKTIAGTGIQQEQVTCTVNTWVVLADPNPNRMFLTIQNVGANPVYLYQGATAPAAVDGSVAFKMLRAAGAGIPYAEFVSGDAEAQFRGKIWGLALVGGSTAQVGEW